MNSNWLPNQEPDYFLTEVFDACALYGVNDVMIHVEGRAPMSLVVFMAQYGTKALPKELFKGQLVLFGVVLRTGLACPKVRIEQKTPGMVPVTHFVKRRT